MTEDVRLIYRGDKCAAIIKALNNLYGLSLEEATDMYYESKTSQLIEDRIADLHCRSEQYLATLIWEEYNNKK